MILKNKIILGIDTSCYTTSIAAINLERKLILSDKKMLSVKKGNKGLRQSEAVFQHVNNLGDMFENIKSKIKEFEIVGICASSKPRSIKGSYMPVFNCGYKFAKGISSVLNIPLYETSHQDGHIEAAFFDTKIDKDEFICVHMSGGTTEILLVNKFLNRYNLEIIGGTKDISVGQLIDRIGVKFEYPFPCGFYIDENAMKCNEEVKNLRISSKEGFMNFSGMETKIYSLINDYSKEYISKLTLKVVSDSLYKALIYLSEKYKVKDILFVGGVSSSKYISSNLSDNLKSYNINTYFTKSEYAKDNAIGVSLIGLNSFLGGI
ncbi:O-sialoglycoprotein endopeptidase [Tepidibacter formicigenes]|jgi:N6-L-threonylcarbamoyladenine synthase|uniref:N(6)-L-threonylcarbamoyladenine synthase n=1 Tax=Tepidibacter formicigenes DSM 15518 TaxID=1123349 RepID=A0A1M6L2R5_9FIRM|nr:O-sialoglycoprotein endopeptidase [Tepidibacter formicigenes]SHJ65456.1 N6-L-threonylcarbamoyladenine synthase [Tepidibacter formicigenes DSM 15518]